MPLGVCQRIRLLETGCMLSACCHVHVPIGKLFAADSDPSQRATDLIEGRLPSLGGGGRGESGRWTRGGHLVVELAFKVPQLKPVAAPHLLFCCWCKGSQTVPTAPHAAVPGPSKRARAVIGSETVQPQSPLPPASPSTMSGAVELRGMAHSLQSSNRRSSLRPHASHPYRPVACCSFRRNTGYHIAHTKPHPLSCRIAYVPPPPPPLGATPPPG